LSNFQSLPKDSFLPNSGYGLGPSFVNAPARKALNHYNCLKNVNLSNFQSNDIGKNNSINLVDELSTMDEEKRAYLVEDENKDYDNLKIHNRQAYFESMVVNKEENNEVDVYKNEILFVMKEMLNDLQDISFVVLPEEANRMFSYSEEQIKLAKRSNDQQQKQPQKERRVQKIQLINNLFKIAWHYLHALGGLSKHMENKKKNVDEQRKSYIKKINIVIQLISNNIQKMQNEKEKMESEKRRLEALNKHLEQFTSSTTTAQVRKQPDTVRDEVTQDQAAKKKSKIQFSL